MPISEGLIGNADEARMLALGLGGCANDTMESLVYKICKFELHPSVKRRFILVTDAENPTMLGIRNKKGKIVISSYETPVVPKEKIMTTNGAGDIFCGSFLGSLIMD